MLIAFSLTPAGGAGASSPESMSEAVAAAVRVVRSSGLPNETNAMFTLVEGDWDEVMAVVKAATDAVAALAPRVSLVLKADLRAGASDALHTKVAALERALS